MSIVRVRRTPSGALALVLLSALLGAQLTAQRTTAGLGPLLTESDLAKFGLGAVVLAARDGYDHTDRLSFRRASDRWLVLDLFRFDVKSLGGGTLRRAVGVVSTGVVSVSGVGDEAYSFDNGQFLIFRKGTAAFQLASGRDPSRDERPFVTPRQLAELAKIICGRL
jgi:hypothetical protein